MPPPASSPPPVPSPSRLPPPPPPSPPGGEVRGAADVLSCLAGIADGGQPGGRTRTSVDLWRLRSLALRPGGLGNSEGRRRAWPKLLGVDAVSGRLLGNGDWGGDGDGDGEAKAEGEGGRPRTDLPRDAIRALRDDVRRCRWDVEGHVREARRRSEEAEEAEEGQAGSAARRAPLGDRSNASAGPAGEETKAAPAAPPSPPRTRTRQERHVLLGILSSALGRGPNARLWRTDAVRLPSQGMADLAALLLLNLGSPNLSALVLRRLVEHPLRQAAAASDAVVSTAAAGGAAPDQPPFPLLPTLLGRVDPPLRALLFPHDDATALRRCGAVERWASLPALGLPTALAAAGATWEGQGTGGTGLWAAGGRDGLGAASRLLDALLVSSSHFPQYLAAVLLSHPLNRLRIYRAATAVKVAVTRGSGDEVGAGGDAGGSADAGPDAGSWASSDLLGVLASLPPDMVAAARGRPAGTLAGAIDSAVGDAVRLMGDLPPTALLARRGGAPPPRPPPWATCPTAPTDLTLLQRSRGVGGGVGGGIAGEGHELGRVPASYRIALDAAGLDAAKLASLQVSPSPVKVQSQVGAGAITGPVNGAQKKGERPRRPSLGWVLLVLFVAFAVFLAAVPPPAPLPVSVGRAAPQPRVRTHSTLGAYAISGRWTDLPATVDALRGRYPGLFPAPAPAPAPAAEDGGDPAADDRGRQGLSGAIRAASPSTTAATTTLGQGSELATTPFEVDPSREGGTGEGAGSAMEMRGLSGAIFAALPSLHYYSPVPIY